MANLLKIKSGLKASLPTLNESEFAFTTDSQEVYIGSGGSNIRILSEDDLYTDSYAVSAIKNDSAWNASNWDTAYNWGDHANQGYATETWVSNNYATSGHSHSDLHSHSNKSVLDGISSTDVSNWNTAYNERGSQIAGTGLTWDGSKLNAGNSLFFLANSGNYIVNESDPPHTMIITDDPNWDWSSSGAPNNSIWFDGSMGKITLYGQSDHGGLIDLEDLDNGYNLQMGHYVNGDSYIKGVTSTTEVFNIGLQGHAFFQSVNFAALSSAPSNLVAGQMWYDSGSNVFKYYNGSSTKTLRTGSNTNYYVSGLSFDDSNGDLTATVTGAANQTANLDGRYSLQGHSHNYDNYNFWVFGANDSSGTLINSSNVDSGRTILLEEGTNVSFTYYHYTDETILKIDAASNNSNYYLSGLSFDDSSGDLTATVSGASNQSANLDGRYSLQGHTHSYDNYGEWRIEAEDSGGNNLLDTGVRGQESVRFVEGNNISFTTQDNSNEAVITINASSNNDYINSASFNDTSGDLTLSGSGSAGATVNLDGRYLRESDLFGSLAWSGTDIDWSDLSVRTKTLSTDETWTFSNLWSGKTITVYISGDYKITFPSYVTTISGSYDGTTNNVIIFHCIDDTSGSEVVIGQIYNL